jgi:hypothetical protein
LASFGKAKEIGVRRLGLIVLLALSGPAAANADPDEADRKVADMLLQAKSVYGVPDPRLRCRPKPGSDEIVVCVDRGEDLKVDRGAPDPNTLEGRRALNNGIPRAPQFDHGSCRGKPGCITAGWAPPPVYYIDMTAIPEPPPGSDADKIAKGEMPEP